MNEFAEAKRAFRAEKKYENLRAARAAREASLEWRAQWRRRLRCFWTWPWGHCLQRASSGYIHTCVACGAEIDRTPGGGY